MSKEDLQHLKDLLSDQFKNKNNSGEIPEELKHKVEAKVHNENHNTNNYIGVSGSTGIAKHKFEVPFNGFDDLLPRMSELDDVVKEHVKFIYLPCHPDHGIVTSPGDRKNEMSVDDTLATIKDIQNRGFEPAVLIQRGDYLDGMEFYVGEGVKYFTIGDDNLAKKARDKWGDGVYLTASVTNLRSFNDYFKVEPGLYDMMILYFWFNRNIEHIKALPKWNEYGIFVNNLCMWNCPWPLSHWFPDRYVPRGEFKCTDIRFGKDNSGMIMENVCYIKPNDLHYFEDYVGTYKLVDRMFDTDHIISDLTNYTYQVDVPFAQFKDPSLGEENYQIEQFAPTDTVDKIRVAEERGI